MAEFMEVMKQGKRMCKTYNSCDHCKIYKRKFTCPIIGVADGNYEVIERIIMDWASAHPEPRYPTWEEWHKSNFPNAGHPVCPKFFSIGICDLHKECYECRAQPIPADIAQKLGIKPIAENK